MSNARSGRSHGHALILHRLPSQSFLCTQVSDKAWPLVDLSAASFTAVNVSLCVGEGVRSIVGSGLDESLQTPNPPCSRRERDSAPICYAVSP